MQQHKIGQHELPQYTVEILVNTNSHNTQSKSRHLEICFTNPVSIYEICCCNLAPPKIKCHNGFNYQTTTRVAYTLLQLIVIFNSRLKRILMHFLLLKTFLKWLSISHVNLSYMQRMTLSYLNISHGPYSMIVTTLSCLINQWELTFRKNTILQIHISHPLYKVVR